MCVCMFEPNNQTIHAVVHSGAQIDDLQNYVRTMGSHSMRKYFFTFRILYFMFHFVMGSDSVKIVGYVYASLW